MKRLMLCSLFAFGALLLPACESERQVTTTTTTTEETVTQPTAVTTQTTRTY
jgi:outer membrane biogenesis lipoprotein LolB